MVQPVRRILFATILVFHSAISLGGPGLHALPGWSHGSDLNPFSKNDHSHGPGKSSHQLAEDCSVCQFLTDRQISSDPPTIIVVWHFDRQKPTPDPRQPFASIALLANPRAPPSPSVSA